MKNLKSTSTMTFIKGFIFATDEAISLLKIIGAKGDLSFSHETCRDSNLSEGIYIPSDKLELFRIVRGDSYNPTYLSLKK